MDFLPLCTEAFSCRDPPAKKPAANNLLVPFKMRQSVVPLIKFSEQNKFKLLPTH
jgi:hypothetical protein